MRYVNFIFFLVLLLRSVEAQNISVTPWQAPPEPAVAQKLESWRDWKFGVIIHWGPYSVWGVTESWTICPEDEPWCERKGVLAENYFEYVKHYEQLATSFNPEKFNPTRWAEACRKAGVRYMIFTTRHHDGFCMYDSKYSDYKITAPWIAFSHHPMSDITCHVFNAFRAEGLGIGVYYSKPDWHHPDYWWPYFPPFDRNVNYNPEKYPEKWDRFKQYVYHQIDELTRNYGPVDILWLDGGWVRPEESLTEETRPWLGKNQWIQDIGMDSLVSVARKNQPGLIGVDRTVHGPYENYLTPEHQIPDEPLPYPWESCIPLGDSWYTTGPEEHFKSTQWIIHTLVKIVARGGNLLLGIGPDSGGDFPLEVYQRLEETGIWLKQFGEAIYGTRPQAPYQEGSWYFTSRPGGNEYAILLKESGEDPGTYIKLPPSWASHTLEISIPGIARKIRPEDEAGGQLIRLTPKEAAWIKTLPALMLERSHSRD
ncbi:MAG: alpha-L-fucosidase [Bacteroidales bacterium]